MERFSLMRRIRRRIEAFCRGRDGVSAVEFTLVGFPFLVLLFGIIETGYVFLLAILLEGAAADGARLVRTGEVPLAADPGSTFRTAVCDGIYNMLPCSSLKYDIRDVTDFTTYLGATAPALPTVQQTDFSTIDAGDTVVVRVAYQWTFITPLLENLLGANANGVRHLVATVVFRNEDYE